jgi:PTH1 family peptidyl-tRNA hydrolase
VPLFGRGERRERRAEGSAILVVGLGNPGREYVGTRHNVGFDAIERLAVRLGVTLRVGRDRASVAEARIGDRRVVLAEPTTYMNESGAAVGALARRHGIEDPAKVVVVHDELDLPPGVVRVKVGGGLAGHNGLRSIASHLGTNDFLRVRIGVGKPPSKDHGADHVLSRPTGDDKTTLDAAVEVAVEAVYAIVEDGAESAMRSTNSG